MEIKMKTYLTLLFILCVNSGLFSQKVGQVDCGITAETQSEINECTKKKSELADQQLNEVALKLISYIRDCGQQAQKEGDQKDVVTFAREETLFIDSQKKWISYRDAYCEFIKQFWVGGSGMPGEVYNARRELTEERIKVVNTIKRQFYQDDK